MKYHLLTLKMKMLMNKYVIYKQESLNEQHGKTVQFYRIYLNLIHHYLNVSRSIRIGDCDLVNSVLPKITNLIFICNHDNYARWTVKYNCKLLTVSETHSHLYEGF